MAARKSNNAQSSKLKVSFNPLEFVARTLQGRMFVTLEFFKRNWLYVIGVTIMFLMVISNKYVYQNGRDSLINLKEVLNNARTDYVDASSTYNSSILESQMKHRIDSMGIDLNIADVPPYELKSDNN